jgi:hypothetical protein
VEDIHKIIEDKTNTVSVFMEFNPTAHCPLFFLCAALPATYLSQEKK